MDKELIARNLLRQRTKRGITQEQLAERSGVGIRTIQRTEAAAALPHLSTLALLAQALELPVLELTERGVEPAPAVAAPPGSTRDLVVLHLLPLTGLVLPLANVLAPLFFWLYRRETDARLEAQGRVVLNFQVTMMLGTGLAVALLLLYFPAGAILLLSVTVFGLGMSIGNARQVQRGAPVHYPLAIPLLKAPKTPGGAHVAAT